MPEGGEEAKVHQQKLRVVYLPPEGQVLVEDPEEEPAPLAPPTVLSNSGSEPVSTVPSVVHAYADDIVIARRHCATVSEWPTGTPHYRPQS